MSTPRLARLFIDAMAKHLPPSAASLKLVDVDGAAGTILRERRADLDVIPVAGTPDSWSLTPESVDAVVAFNHSLKSELLEASLKALRPGGRLVIMETDGNVDDLRVKTLESAGYTRILVEAGIECPLPAGVLMRGEKPHTTDDTLERIQQVASEDENAQTLADFKGRYVHLLVMQTPNKPAWALEAGETLRWQAVTSNGALLAFSSLPKAVALMQPAVVAGSIKDVNKVAKFSKVTAQTWTLPVIVNPTLESLADQTIGWIEIDSTTAETPDE